MDYTTKKLLTNRQSLEASEPFDSHFPHLASSRERHDARMAHEQREVMRGMHAAMYEAEKMLRACKCEGHARMLADHRAAAAPFLEA